MHIEKKKVLMLFAVSILIVFITILALKLYIDYENNVVYSFNQELSSEAYKSNDFYVDIVTGKHWNETNNTGAQYDGVIHNNSKVDIVDWHINFIVPEQSVIDSSWSGVFEMSTDSISVKPVDYNMTILPGSEQTFGLVMITNKLFEVNSIAISGHKNYKITDFILFRIIEVILLIIIIFFVTYLVFENRMNRLILEKEEYKKVVMQSLKTFANIIDAKDPYTKGHSFRVAIYAQEISRRMGKTKEEQRRIYQISLLHDIGKIGIDNAILNKPGKLSYSEYELIKKHTTTGGDILKDFTAIEGIEEGARFHHEMIDGGGYPNGVKGAMIPECARIICVADAFDAMNSDRCYRHRLPRSKTIEELKRCSGAQFDSVVVEHMLDMIHDGFDIEEDRLMTLIDTVSL